MLVGLHNQQSLGSTLVLVSLVNRQQTSILAAPSGGYLDALQVRYGAIFIARALSLNGPYDISMVTGSLSTGLYGTSVFMNISIRASLIEICRDKGMNTSFVYSNAFSTANKLYACYPGSGCVLWTTSVGVTGMVCGIDCLDAVFVSTRSVLLKVTSSTSVTVVSSTSTINCISSVPELSVVLFRTGTVVKQLSVGASGSTLYDSVLTLDAPTTACTVCCSLDVSDSNAQIMLVEGGLINTVEAFQQPCGYEMRCYPVISNASSSCFACPQPPANAFMVMGSPTCQWQRQRGFTSVGTQCVALSAMLPCQPRFIYRDGQNRFQ